MEAAAKDAPWVGMRGAAQEAEKPRPKHQGALQAWEAADRRGGTPAATLRGKGAPPPWRALGGKGTQAPEPPEKADP